MKQYFDWGYLVYMAKQVVWAVENAFINGLTAILTTLLWGFPVWREKYWEYRATAWRKHGQRPAFYDFIKFYFFKGSS